MKTTVMYGLYLVVLLGLCSWVGYECGRKSQPTAAVQIAHEQTVQAESLAARVDTVVQTKTKTLTKTLAQYDTVRDSVKITDTLVVKEFVERCDALKQSCEDYKASAIQKFAADSAVFHAKDREIAALIAARPSTLGQFTKYALVGLAGYAAGRLSVGVHFSLP